MAIVKLQTVQSNTAPPIEITCKRQGVVLDLTNCTVALILVRGKTVVNTGHQACVIVTPTAGTIRYTPQAGDFTAAGKYKADIKVTYSDLSTEILYDQLQITARRKNG